MEHCGFVQLCVYVGGCLNVLHGNPQVFIFLPQEEGKLGKLILILYPKEEVTFSAKKKKMCNLPSIFTVWRMLMAAKDEERIQTPSKGEKKT